MKSNYLTQLSEVKMGVKKEVKEEVMPRLFERSFVKLKLQSSQTKLTRSVAQDNGFVLEGI